MDAPPRFAPEPSSRRPAPRLAFVVAAGLTVLVGGASILNAQRFSLRCEGGSRVPYRGRLAPAGEIAIDDADFPAVPIADGDVCHDEEFSGRAGFEQRYVEAAVGRADAVVQAADGVDALDDAADVLDSVARLPAAATEAFAERRLALAEAMLATSVERATEARRDALDRLARAREAGLPEATLQRYADRLGVQTESEPDLDPLLRADAPEPEATPAPPSDALPPGSRAL